MSRCHYIYTEDGLKVFVPGCMGCAVHGPDKAYCTCGSRQYKSDESKRNKELRSSLHETENELADAYRTIKKIIRTSKKHVKTCKTFKNMIPVKVKLNGGMMPQKATKGSAAFDIYVPEDVEIGHGRQVIDMKFAIELPESKAALIKPRSGCTLRGIQVLNTVTGKTHCIDAEVKIGLVDSDYRKNVGTLLQVYDVPVLGERWIIQKGSRISQMRIVDVPEVELVEVSELSESERDGGFGSTGVL